MIDMQCHVIVVSKGRPAVLCELVRRLESQTQAPASVTVVGVTEADVVGLPGQRASNLDRSKVLLSGRAGACLQRNVGIDYLARSDILVASTPSFVVFFDDDFVPANDWIERCSALFDGDPGVTAVTGRILADGAHGYVVTGSDANAYLDGTLQPRKHWASGGSIRTVSSVYGCNMAFRNLAVLACRFDENLPLYGWQEDQDYTGQVRRFGKVVYLPTCRGVHLGVKGGRTSGVKIGYSQIANPLYLVKKGTMHWRKAARFFMRHLASNMVHSLSTQMVTDYQGRMRGNFMAIRDLFSMRCHPQRIFEINDGR